MARNSIQRDDQRKKEVLNICLDKFIAKGIYNTSSRDLSSAIGLQSGGIYYYFKTIDDAIIACANEAANRLEINLILPALQDANKPETILPRLRSRADEMASTMRFFVQVCANSKFRPKMESTLSRLCERYVFYTERFAEVFECKQDVIAPVFYICISAFTDYMIFGKDLHINPQINLVKHAIEDIVKK